MKTEDMTIEELARTVFHMHGHLIKFDTGHYEGSSYVVHAQVQVKEQSGVVSEGYCGPTRCQYADGGYIREADGEIRAALQNS
jgi:hypothetical protein